MLVLSRKKNQRILLKVPGRKDIQITVTKIDSRNRVRLGIDADSDVVVVREELEANQPSSVPVEPE